MHVIWRKKFWREQKIHKDCRTPGIQSKWKKLLNDRTSILMHVIWPKKFLREKKGLIKIDKRPSDNWNSKKMKMLNYRTSVLMNVIWRKKMGFIKNYYQGANMF